MPYNPAMYFPQNYQPYFQQQNPQMMTPPTIHAEIVQVGSEQEAASYPVGVGSSQMMIAKDDSAIFVKSATANGVSLDVFVKRPPTPQEPPFDPSMYVTKDELESRLAALRASREVEHEPV